MYGGCILPTVEANSASQITSLDLRGQFAAVGREEKERDGKR